MARLTAICRSVMTIARVCESAAGIVTMSFRIAAFWVICGQTWSFLMRFEIGFSWCSLGSLAALLSCIFMSEFVRTLADVCSSAMESVLKCYLQLEHDNYAPAQDNNWKKTI